MKKKLKKQINQTVRSVFIYYLILVGVSFLYILWKSTVVTGQTGAGVFSGQMMKYAADKAGILSLAGTAAGLFYMAVRYRKTKRERTDHQVLLPGHSGSDAQGGRVWYNDCG